MKDCPYVPLALIARGILVARFTPPTRHSEWFYSPCYASPGPMMLSKYLMNKWMGGGRGCQARLAQSHSAKSCQRLDLPSQTFNKKCKVYNHWGLILWAAWSRRPVGKLVEMVMALCMLRSDRNICCKVSLQDQKCWVLKLTLGVGKGLEYFFFLPILSLNLVSPKSADFSHLELHNLCFYPAHRLIQPTQSPWMISESCTPRMDWRRNRQFGPENK